jgi:hypothetical protein
MSVLFTRTSDPKRLKCYIIQSHNSNVLCCVVRRYVIWSAMLVGAIYICIYIYIYSTHASYMYVCMGGERAARSTLCIESI